MKRDEFYPTKVTGRSFSSQSNSSVMRLIEAIGKSNEPTATQFADLERAYESTASHLAECEEFKGQFIEIHAHGSRQLGTLVRPIDEERNGFDVDLVARLPKSSLHLYTDDGGPARLLQNLYVALKRYADQYHLRIKKWERCVTLEYASGMTADIAPIIDSPLYTGLYGETHSLIPDRDLCTLIGTNPRGYAIWFDRVAAISPIFTLEERLVRAAMDSVDFSTEIAPLPDPAKVFQRVLCRLVQLMKLHRNTAFIQSDFAPSSIFITTLAALAYEEQARIPHATPLDLLLDIVESLPTHFDRDASWRGDEIWHLENPSVPRDNLASSMNTAATHQEAFIAWHKMLSSDIRILVESIEHRTGFENVHAHIKSAFGDRAGRAFQQDELARRNAERKAGQVTLLTAAGSSLTIPSKKHEFFGD